MTEVDPPTTHATDASLTASDSGSSSDVAPKQSDNAKPGPAKARRRVYAVVPSHEVLTDDECEVVGRGGAYPVRVANYLPEHEDFLDFLVDASLVDWAKASGGSR
ncbi:MAG: hypothetical protein ACHREM_01720 [Polyangiales bacterium]